VWYFLSFLIKISAVLKFLVLNNSQIGSKITSKRISQFLEFHSPHAYILVDKHPCRHDPSHIVTHRVQSMITEFTDILLRIQVSRKLSKWSLFLKAMDMTVTVIIFHWDYASKFQPTYWRNAENECGGRGLTGYCGTGLTDSCNRRVCIQTPEWYS